MTEKDNEKPFEKAALSGRTDRSSLPTETPGDYKSSKEAFSCCKSVFVAPYSSNGNRREPLRIARERKLICLSRSNKPTVYLQSQIGKI